MTVHTHEETPSPSPRTTRAAVGRLRRSVGVIAAAALAGTVVAACSSSSSSSAPPANKATMSTALIRASDVPSSWQSTGPTTSDNTAQTRAYAVGISACNAYVSQLDQQKSQLKAISNTFVDASMPSSSQNDVYNEVIGYSSEDLAKSTYGIFTSANMTTCMQQVFDKAMKAAVSKVQTQTGVTPTVKVQVQRISVPPAGDASSAIEATVLISEGSSSEQLGLVIQLVRVGPYLVTYNGTLYAPNPAGFSANLVSATIGRLTAAMAKQ